MIIIVIRCIIQKGKDEELYFSFLALFKLLFLLLKFHHFVIYTECNTKVDLIPEITFVLLNVLKYLFSCYNF